jgi:hypothetical protein
VKRCIEQCQYKSDNTKDTTSTQQNSPQQSYASRHKYPSPAHLPNVPYYSANKRNSYEHLNRQHNRRHPKFYSNLGDRWQKPESTSESGPKQTQGTHCNTSTSKKKETTQTWSRSSSKEKMSVNQTTTPALKSIELKHSTTKKSSNTITTTVTTTTSPTSQTPQTLHKNTKKINITSW